MPVLTSVVFNSNLPPTTFAVATSLLAMPSNKVTTVWSGTFFMLPLISKDCAVKFMLQNASMKSATNFLIIVFILIY